MNMQTQPVTASLVSESQRLDFLPSYFGLRLMMRGEALTYAWLCRLCERYSGAYWHYYTLSDGGFYMAPDLETCLEIKVVGNGFRGVASADAAGIVATLFALGQLAAEAAGTEAADALIDHYYSLRGFAAVHHEAALIFRAID